VGYALRYGIPVGIIGWGLFEMFPTYFVKLYPNAWIKPFQYPVTTLVVVSVYIACFVYFARYSRPTVGSTEPVRSAL
jgi:hypothetical protein